MKNKTVFLILLIFLEVWGAMGQHQTDQVKNDDFTLDKSVRFGKLANGFTYYLRRNNFPANTITLQLIVKAGGYHEDEDQLGYAHLLEHMGAKGTKHFPLVKDYFRTSGRYSHANTTNDFTRYIVEISSDDKQGLKSALQLIRDWAQDIRFEQRSIAVERGAVLGEGRRNDWYNQWLSDEIEEQVVRNTGFKKHTKKELDADIQNFNRNAFFRFYKEWYRPDLQAAIIVGDFNVESGEVEIKRLFSDLKMPKDPKDAQERVDNQIIRLKGDNQFVKIIDTVHPHNRIYIVSKQINHEFRPKNRTDYKQMLLQQLYREIVDSRSKRLEQKYDPPFEHYTAKYRANTLGGGQLYAEAMIVDLDTNHSQEMKKKFIDGLIAWKQIHNGWTKSEMDDAKDQIRKRYSDPVLQSSAKLAEKYLYHFVSGGAAPHPETELRLVFELLGQIDLKEMQNFAHEYGDLNQNTDFLLLAGRKGEVPKIDLFKKWVTEFDEKEIAPLEAPKPPINTLKGTIEIPVQKKPAVDQISENLIGVSTVKLGNGIRLILKPTEPRSKYFANTVSIRAYRPNKVPIGNREEYLAAKIAPEILKYSGAGSFTKFELDRFMREKDLQIEFKINKDAQIINGECKVDTVEELLNLLYLYFDHPRKDPKAFAAWKNHQKMQMKMPIRSSSEFYLDDIRAFWYPQVPKLKVQDLRKLSMEKVFSALDQWYSDFKGYTFIVTGDFSKDSLAPVLMKYLSTFPVKNSSFEPVPEFEFPLKKMSETIRVKNIDQANVRLYFPVTAPRDIKTQVELRILSKALGDRIWDRLREGCYAPGASGKWVDAEKGVYAFEIRFDSDLGNEEKMIRYAKEEFRKLREHGIDQKWYHSAVADEEKAYGRRLESFGYFNFWPDYLQEKLNNRGDLQEEILKYQPVLEHFTTVDEVNEAAKKYLSEKFLQQFLVLPERY